MNKQLKAAAGLFLIAFSAVAGAQPAINIGSDTVATGGTVAIPVNLDADGTITQLNLTFTYDSDKLTADISNCGGSNETISPGSTSCSVNPTGVDAETGEVNIVHGQLGTTPLSDGTFGNVSFTATGVNVGESFPLTLTTQSFSNAAGDRVDPSGSTNGLISVACPDNESCYASIPDINTLRDFGAAVVVGTTTTAMNSPTVTVYNSQDSGAPGDSFDIVEAGTGGSFDVGSSGTITVLSPGAFPASVPADGTDMAGDPVSPVDVNFSCTPGERGEQTGTLSIANNADNPASTPTYPFTCTGLSPLASLPADFGLTGFVSGANETAILSVDNQLDMFSSNLNNLDVTDTGNSAEISIAPVTTQNGIAPGTSADYTVTCDTSAEGTFQETFNFTWTQPDPNLPSSGSVTVDCTVSDTAPIYGSAPESPGETITLSAPFGTTVSSLLDVFNENPQGDAFNITGASIINAGPFAGSFSVDELNSGPFTGDGSGTADGTDDLRVNCTPPGVGLISADLEVVTDNAGTKTYPLNCTGTGDPLTSTPAFGGTLSLGSVPPGTQAGPGTIEFSNNLLEGGIELDCTKENDPEGIFTFMQIPVDLEIAPQTTATVDVTAVPTEIGGPFDAVLDCQVFVDEVITDQPFARGMPANQIRVSVFGRPLVIPTMSRWGLVAMSLMLLLVGGFATRRMMA